MLPAGPRLAVLLLGGFRALVDAAIVGLDEQGFGEVRPVHVFAMNAIAEGADTASELGRRLSVSKQAAAKTIATLIERKFVTREQDPTDGRRRTLRVTSLGLKVVAQGEKIINGVRKQWAKRIGMVEVERLEAHLATLVGDAPDPIDSPGWLAQDHLES